MSQVSGRFFHAPWVSPFAAGALLAIAAAPVGLGTARAQELEVVVVTAERRELSLQETPISVIAFSGETLELKGVRDMAELASIAPNLDIKGSRGTGNTSPTWEIRGISGGGGATGERGVGLYIDNVFMPRTTGPVMRVLDVDRVEVLRGPQGTLFGRNSTGGAIRIFSKQPGPERDGYVRITGGNYDHYDVTGMVNLPLTEQVFLRAQGAYLHTDGFLTRGPQELGGSEDTVGRLQLAVHPSDTLSLTFSALHNDSESDGSPTDLVGFNMAPACPTDPSNPYICWEGGYSDWVSDFLEQAGQARLTHDDPRLLLNDFTMPSWCFLDDADPDWDDLCRQWNKSDYSQADMSIDWDLSSGVTMTATTGLSTFSSDGVSDWQLMGMEYRRAQVNSDVFYQEVQFNLDAADGRVELVTGINYFDETSDSPRSPLINAIGSSTWAGQQANGNLWGCFAENGFCGSEPPRLRVTGDSFTQQDSTAVAVFASATTHLTDRLDLTLGLRSSHDEKDILNTVYASDNFIPQDGVSSTYADSDSWSDIDWRATLGAQATDDLMLYVTGSKAFRAGSFNTSTLSPAQTGLAYHIVTIASVPPEELLNREVGMRSEWIDDRLRVNLTYYDMDFANRQGASAVAEPSSPVGFTIQLVNQGDVDLWGTELEAEFAVTERLLLDAAAGWANYEMHDPCINNGLYIFPPPMDDSYTLGARYQAPLQRGGLTFSVNLSHRGGQETHPGGLTAEQAAAFNCPAGPGGPPVATWFRDSRYRLPDYDVVNAVLRFTADGGRWSASLYANNLTDETYANNGQSFGRGYWTAGGPALGLNSVMRGAQADYRERPRELGLTLQYNF